MHGKRLIACPLLPGSRVYGSEPVEASLGKQRKITYQKCLIRGNIGFETDFFNSLLNPVAVLINKAMIELPPKFVGWKPVGPVIGGMDPTLQTVWPGISGLSEDIRRYGSWIHSQVVQRIGCFYPPVQVTEDATPHRPDLVPLLGRQLRVIAWIWVRTVKSPNPAFSHVDVPLASTFILSNKPGNEAWVEPIIQGDRYSFQVRVGTPPPQAFNGTKVKKGVAPNNESEENSRSLSFRCLLSDTPISSKYIKDEGINNRLGVRLMALVVEGLRGRTYLNPLRSAEEVVINVPDSWSPKGNIPPRLTGGTCVPYGFKEWGDIFTQRQKLSLNTLSDLVLEVREKIISDISHNETLENGSLKNLEFSKDYAEAICTYLAFAIDRCADFNNVITRWVPGNQKVMNLFAKQAIPMTWDFPEAGILLDTVGGFLPAVEYICECMQKLSPSSAGFALQADAKTQNISINKVVSTDPPYYDNIGYADLSDFFYVWLRRSLKDIYPNLFTTISTPKEDELVATSYRYRDGEDADKFFLRGMISVMKNLSIAAHPEPPITIYYAFKQSETKDQNTSSSGWETFLHAVLSAGFMIVGTWPLRSEQEYRMVSMGKNALASSIVLVCRKRPQNAPRISRREFMRELNAVLPEALDEMTKGSGEDQSPVAPVDLSQAIIGPGMAVFSKYAAVLEADGSVMSVRTALQLINRFLAEDDFDPDTQFCLHWFEEQGWKSGVFGQADVLARAKGTSVGGVKDSGVIESSAGHVRLLKWNEYPNVWEPASDSRLPTWEALHHLIRALKNEGETAAGRLLSGVMHRAESIRQLSYRLYTLCERQGLAEDARAYNELITSWNAIEAATVHKEKTAQKELFE